MWRGGDGVPRGGRTDISVSLQTLTMSATSQSGESSLSNSDETIEPEHILWLARRMSADVWNKHGHRLGGSPRQSRDHVGGTETLSP